MLHWLRKNYIELLTCAALLWLAVAAVAGPGLAAQSPGPTRQEQALERIAVELHDLNQKLDRNNKLQENNFRATSQLRDSMSELKRSIERL